MSASDLAAISRAQLDPVILFVAVTALLNTIVTAITVTDVQNRRTTAPARSLLAAAILAAALGFVALAATLTPALVAAAAVALAATLLVLAALPRLTGPGAITTVLPLLALVAGALWTDRLLAAHDFPGWSRTLFLAGIALAALGASVNLASGLVRNAVLTHRHWRRPTIAPAAEPGGYQPRVSIHLPCYAEPPEVVMATLDHLAALDYPHFEVLVCDNNTADEALWRPLEVHCARLNRRLGTRAFRFFHLDKLPGAKAGALNVCLQRMASDAELVAVIDADYFSAPDFLARLTGFFADPTLGYVQTPHDYRDHDDPWLRLAYWEYMPINKVDYPGISEYGAAFTIGTMCILRTRALREAGGWAEWCLTEDSEVSIRLRALGYHGLYLPETFGRGLIPGTFGDYKKQRFRWTAGPVQQVVRHWRMFVPRFLGGSTAMPGWSKLLEVERSIAPLQLLAAMVLAGLATTATVIATLAGELPRLTLPAAAWGAAAAATAAALVGTWHRYRLAGCPRLVDMLGGELARLSLTWTILLAGIAGITGRSLHWRRTPKFATGATGIALRSTRTELAIGLLLLAIGLTVASLAAAIGTHLAILSVLGAIAGALAFLAAPIMAIINERQLTRPAADPEPAFAPPLAPAVRRA